MLSALPPRSAFPWYLAASGLWLGAISLHWLVVPWMLIGMLEVSPERYSLARVLIEAPALLALFVGGVLADRRDGRTLLIVFAALACITPLAMASATPTFWAAVAFGVAVGLLQSLSDPARQAALSSVARLDIQRAIVIVMVVSSLVGIAGFAAGGQVQSIGLAWVLVGEAVLFALAGAAAAALPTLPTHHGGLPPNLFAGVSALRRLPLLRDVVALNFVSALVNAGAYTIAMPFIVTEVYGGDAAFLANLFIAFTAGALVSNVALYLAMPILRPGRLFALMQLTRAVILLALLQEPPVWGFFALVAAWGLNMGVTSTLARAIVQEEAPAPQRAQVLALFVFSFMLAAPISAALLGQLVAATDPMTALLPGIPVSALIFALAAWRGELWRHRSPSHPAAGLAAPAARPGSPG